MATLPLEQAQQDVAGVFLSYFNRAPEYEAMAFYVDAYNQLLASQGDDPAAHPNAFKTLAAAIYEDGVRHGEVPAGSSISNEFYVSFLYENVLGREPDPDGLQYWVTQLDQGSIERAELVAYLIDAAAADERDGAYVANRTEVAVAFSQWENSNPQILDTLQYDAAQVIEGVNESPESVDEAMLLLYTNTGPAGGTFVLSAEDDYADTDAAFNGTTPSEFRFTDADETVRAPNGTLGAGDVLNDASTADNDELYARLTGEGSVDAASGVTLGNIEHINFDLGPAAAGGTFSFENATGVQTLTLTGSVGAEGNITLSTFAASGLAQIDATDLQGGVVMAEGEELTEAITVTGGSGADSVYGGAGDDTFDTGEGDDTVNAGEGNNTITTGAGIDTVTAGNGDNTIDTGDGNDSVQVGNGTNTITTGAGDDAITVGNGDNTIDAGEGNDGITVGWGSNTITGGAGADTIALGGGDNALIIAAGDSGIEADSYDVVTGFNSGSDTLNFGAGAGSALNTALGEATDFDTGLTAADEAFASGQGYQYFIASNGTDTWVYVDSDANGAADISIQLAGATGVEATDIV